MPVEPTLLIGLGGTGKEVLLRIRRRFYESGITEQPWISYLWMDTAASNPREGVIKGMESDHIARRTRFKPNEICDLGITVPEAMDVYKNDHAHQNIYEWADRPMLEQVLSTPEGLTTGAKQMPPLGRLALFIRAYRAPEPHLPVIKRLKERLGEIDPNVIKGKIASTFGDDRELLADLELREKEPKVIICGSLAGGTGAGLCVDVAAMLRAGLFSNAPWLQNAFVWGYFVLPEAFCNDRDRNKWEHFKESRVQANGYAMLQEIEQLSLIRSEKSRHFLTGRRNAGKFHATWDYKYAKDTSEAEWVKGPVYHSCYLFDGHCGDTTFDKVSDTYELIANLLYNDLSSLKDKDNLTSARSNAEYAGREGHIETTPVNISPDDPNTIWADLYSFRFAAAGMYRVTYEAPRLQQMAAYTLASKALRGWMGIENPGFKLLPERNYSEDDSIKAQQAERLRCSVEKRLIIELSSAALNQVWSDFYRAKNPSKWNKEAFKFEAFSAEPSATVKSSPPAARTLKSIEDSKIVWNPDDLFETFKAEYLTGEKGRLRKLMRDLIKEESPLFRITHDLPSEKTYAEQGGVGAARHAVQVLPQKLLALVADLKLRADAQAIEARKARENAAAIVETADADMLWLARAKEDFWVCNPLFKTLDHLEDRARSSIKETQEALDKYAQHVYAQGLFDCMSKAWSKFAESPQFKAFCSDWDEKLNATTRLLRDLLQYDPKTSNEKKDWWGLEQVLKSFREMKKDASTTHLGEAIQSDEKLLWEEIRKIFDNNDRDLLNSILQIQETIVTDSPKWLKNDETREEAGEIRHVVDLALDPIVKNGRADFSKLIEMLLLVTTRVTKDRLKEIPKGRNILQDLPNHKSDLITRSRCCLSLPEPIRRRAHGDMLEEPTRHESWVVACAHEVKLDSFRFIKSRDPMEIRAFRFSCDVPLPNIQVLEKTAAFVAGAEPAHLHFTHPKSGFMPIHSLSERTALETQERYVTALLAVILGQLRPDAKSECFELHVDPMDGVFKFPHIKSLTDIVRNMEHGSLKNSFETIQARNKHILADMGPVALVGLMQIVKYNLRYVAPNKINFYDKAGELIAQHSPFDMQKLVFQKVLSEVTHVLRRKGVRAGRDERDERLIPVLNAVGDLMHHYSCFVPVNLTRVPTAGKAGAHDLMEQTKLLCLLTRIVQFSDRLKPENDLLKRTPPALQGASPIYKLIALEAPWTIYTETLGQETLHEHEALLKYVFGANKDTEGRTFRPPNDDVEPKTLKEELAKFSQTWPSEKVLVNERAVKESAFYKTLFKSETIEIANLDSLIDDRYRAASGVTA